MKKILVITYYWPPAGGPGVQRILKFVKYLPTFGYQPVVLTVKEGDYPATDQGLIKEIPDNLKVYKTKTREPFRLFKLLTGKKKEDKIPTYILNRMEKEGMVTRLAKWIRANFFIPDARIGWKGFAVKKGLEIIENEGIELILTSSPPQTVQLIGLELAQKTGLKWIADFRDPWTDAFWIKDLNRTEKSWARDRALEKSVLENADLILTSSNSLRQVLAQKVQNHFEVLTNGYDETDFKEVTKARKNSKFTIVHAGSIAESQNPVNLFKALSELDQDKKSKVEVHLYGALHESIKDSIEKYDVQQVVQFKGYVPHSKVVEKISCADMNMILIPDFETSKNIIPGKLFELLRAGHHILMIGDETCDVSNIIRDIQGGSCFDYNRDLKQFLEKKIVEWEKDEMKLIEQEAISEYSRENLTKKLADHFNSVLIRN